MANENESMATYLEAVSMACDNVPHMCTALASHGLNRPITAWGNLTKQAKEFELEIIKEDHASFTRNIDGTHFKSGYSSLLVNDILNSIEISREKLELLSRSLQQNDLIEKNPYLSSYTQEALTKYRATSMDDVVKENLSEMDAIGKDSVFNEVGVAEKVADIHSMKTSDVLKIVDNIFLGLNFKSKKVKSSEYDGDYFSLDEDCAVGFTIKIGATFKHKPPFFVEIFTKPRTNLTAVVDEKTHIIDANQLIRPLWTVLPDFGRYRVSWDTNGLFFSLYAYKFLIKYFLISGSKK